MLNLQLSATPDTSPQIKSGKMVTKSHKNAA